MPSKRKIRGIVGLLMFFTFIILLCYGINPSPIKEFAINMAKALGMIALGVGGVILIIEK
jgi:hypothetical protein